MTADETKRTLSTIMDLIHDRLQAASEISKAEKACAEVGSLDEAIRITLAIDGPLYEATTLSNAAALIKRLAEE